MFGHRKGSHRNAHQSRRRHSTAHLSSRALRYETLEDRRMLAQLVGIDFDLAGSQVPLNWNRVSTLGNILYANLIDEAGTPVPFDLVVNGTAAPADQGVILGNNDPAPGTIPNHPNPLANLHGFAFAENSPTATINATWSDLDPIRTYEIFVIGFDGDGLSNVQNVSIVGSGTTGFSQSPSSNELWINGEKGDSSRTFDSYAVLAQPDAAGEIAIATQVASGGVVLGGLAIRQLDSIEVNSAADNTTPADGLVTLREAIIAANGNADPATITFDPAVFGTPNTIALGSQLPTITNSVTITGPGQSLLTLDAGNGVDNTFATGDGFRIFEIDDSTTGLIDVTLSGMTLTGGDTANGADGLDFGGSGKDGGAIFSRENLTLLNSTITGNATGNGGNGISSGGFGGNGGDGAGIFSRYGDLTIAGSNISGNVAGNGGSDIGSNTFPGSGGDGGGIGIHFGNLSIADSTLSGNQTGASDSVFLGGRGGGIDNQGAVLTISTSTISGNTATAGGRGGGIATDSAYYNSSTSATITDSTISGNQSTVNGGGIANLRTLLTIARSTVTDNTAPAGQGSGISSVVDYFTLATLDSSIVAGNTNSDLDQLSGVNKFQSNGFNLIGTGNATAAFTASGDQAIGTASPGLGPLAENGGDTKTHALLPGSPALDAVGVLDNYSNNNFATNYNFVDLFNGAANNPQVSGGQANLNVGTGTGAYIWNQGEKLNSLFEKVSIDFGFNYPITTAGFGQSSAGLALFDSVTGSNLLAEIRVETNKANGIGSSLNTGSGTTALSGAPLGLMNLSVEVIGTTASTVDVQYTLSGSGFTDITGSLTLNSTEVFFGPVAFDVSGNESVHDNLRFSKPVTVPFDQRGTPFSRVADGGQGLQQDIGAYEAQSAPSADFVDDNVITGLDFLAWQRGFGTTTGATRADGNSDDDGDVDASDLAAWATTFGQVETTPLIAALSVSNSDQAAAALSTNDLLNAAQAWELAYEVNLEQEPLLDNQPTANTVPQDVFFAADNQTSALLASDEVDLIATHSSEADEAETSWLNEKLLEKVFG